MFLGPSEGLGEFGRDFGTENSNYRIYRKINDSRFPLSTLRVSLQSDSRLKSAGTKQRLKPSAVTSINYDRILEHLLKDCIILNSDEEILHILGDAKDYLTLQVGRMTSNISQFIHEDLRSILISGLFRAEKEQHAIRFENIIHPTKENRISINVTPIFEKDSCLVSMYVVHFEEIAKLREDTKSYDLSDSSKHIIHDLELQLKFTKEELNTALEEAETTNEELQSTNEELLASNEELQSTNEELHSVNEELYTVNTEFQKKIDELTTLEDDIDNLLQSANIGTIFIDKDLAIRRLTPAISKNFGILGHDVGRSIESFTYKFNHEQFIDTVREVVGSGIEKIPSTTDL